MTPPESLPVSLALSALERFVRRKERLELPLELPDDLARPAACFVSLHIGEHLRGCIGTIEPTESCLAAEIISNAISAGTHDPRFAPVAPEELAGISCSVDVLNPPEPIPNLDGHDPKQHGLIVESVRGGRRGLLLPDLEGVDTPDEQRSICLAKAGIGPSEPVRLYRFSVTRYH